jgi:xylan 1,4-beta-xylosidase
MKEFGGPFKDVRNYVVTAPAITGPWSEPVYLNASGFDPSLFHDDDGRKWIVNQRWHPTHDGRSFAGIVIQEFSVTQQRLIGEPREIFAGSALGTTEGPHLYRKDGWYYLVTAEGGTSWTHAVTVARSRDLFGPYELSPQHPLLTAAEAPSHPLQKAGHGSFARDGQGRWYLAHLCARVVPGTRRCPLGRETALQPIDWPEGEWPRLAGGGHLPALEFEVAGAGAARPYFDRFEDDFVGETLSPHWNTLREPPKPEWLSLSARPGWLRLRGRHSILSRFDHSLVGCRIAHHRCDLHARLEYDPRSPQQRAGLAVYYNTANFYYLFVSADESGPFVGVLVCDNGRCSEDPTARLPAPRGTALGLRAQLRDGALTFTCACGTAEARPVGRTYDATTLSDDYPLETGAGWAFTGVFAALCAQDATGTAIPADFDWFHYHVVTSP